MNGTIQVQRILTFCFLVFYGLSGYTQDFVIKAGNLILPEEGKMVKNQFIYINNGMISKVSSDLDSGWKGEVIDLHDSWVMPGLFDCHVHLTYNDPVGQFVPPRKYLEESNSFRAMRGLHNAEVLLNAGFTTVKEIGNDGDYATAAVIRAIREGWFKGPTIQYAGKIIAPYGGQIAGISPQQGAVWDYEYLTAETPDEMKKAIRKNIYYGADVIKLVADAFPYYYEQEMIEAAVQEASRTGMKVTVHVMGGEAARNVILGGAAAIEHGFLLDEELLGLMKEKGTFLVGTDFHLDNLKAMGDDFMYMEQFSEAIVRRLKLAYSMGVKMAFGTDNVVDLPGMNRAETNLVELKTWKQAGIPPAEILKCMTVNAAELMDMKGERGEIKAGLRADIIACRDNPLDDIENLLSVYFVMKDGNVIRDDSK